MFFWLKIFTLLIISIGYLGMFTYIFICENFIPTKILYFIEGASITYPFPVVVMKGQNVEVKVLPQYYNKSEICQIEDDREVNYKFIIDAVDDKVSNFVLNKKN